MNNAINNQIAKIKKITVPLIDFLLVFSLMLKNIIKRNPIKIELAPILIFRFVRLSKKINPTIIRRIPMSELR